MLDNHYYFYNKHILPFYITRLLFSFDFPFFFAKLVVLVYSTLTFHNLFPAANTLASKSYLFQKISNFSNKKREIDKIFTLKLYTDFTTL